MLDFAGRVAIVTGAGQGIGRAHARALAARGCKVVVNDLGVKLLGTEAGDDTAEKVAAEIISSGGIAVADRHNVVTEARDIVERAMAEFGRLDILINNAGVVNDGPLDEVPVKAWEAAAEVHVSGTVRMTREAWGALKQSGSGRIVNTTSQAILGSPFVTSYGTAKGAILGFSRNVAEDGRRVGINVNAIMPLAWTRMSGSVEDQAVLDLLSRAFQPEYVAEFVTWLVHSGTDVWKEVFAIGGRGANRVVFGATATTFVDDGTAEAWANTGPAMLEDENLYPLYSTTDLMQRQLQDADPDIDMSATTEAGGTVLKYDRD